MLIKRVETLVIQGGHQLRAGLLACRGEYSQCPSFLLPRNKLVSETLPFRSQSSIGNRTVNLNIMLIQYSFCDPRQGNGYAVAILVVIF